LVGLSDEEPRRLDEREDDEADYGVIGRATATVTVRQSPIAILPSRTLCRGDRHDRGRRAQLSDQRDLSLVF
jgi:hypothetical protein